MIETPRLRLVELPVEEARAILEGERADHYAEGYPADGTLVAAAIVIKTQGALAPWTIYQAQRKEDGRVVAGLGFINPPDAEGRVRIGFSETEEGREYTAEAVAGLIALAHEHGAKVIADTADPRVAEVFEAAGMEPSGVCNGLRQFEA